MIARVLALFCAVAAAALAVYGVLLVYAATSVEYDSLPGPAVLSMVAAGVALAALLCGGLAHVFWRVSKRQETTGRPS